MRVLWQSRLVRLGSAAACLGGLLLAWELRTALRVDLVVPAGAATSPATPRASRAPAPGYPIERVLAALDKDPFNPERRRPMMRFLLPADMAAAAAQRVQSQATEASLRLVGTAVGADGGGFAMCTWQGGSPRIVRIGEKLGGWTLQKVLPGAAEFTTPAGGTITVRVPKAGA